MVSDNTQGMTQSISGQIAGVNLSSFLQMIEMEKKTCTIKVFIKTNLGRIFFLNGTLIDADTKHLKHLEAVYDILSWNNIVIEVEENDQKKRNQINLPLMHVIMESARLADENRQARPPEEEDETKTDTLKNIPLKVMKNKEFCLEIGSRLLIDFEDRAISFRSRLVGIEHGRYLLIKLPNPFNRMDHDLFSVEDLIIKSLYKGTIYAFRSKLITTISKPSQLMFIEYPKKIEHHELRSHKRFKCSIVTQAQVRQKERGGVIENISVGGCLCTIEMFPADKNLSRDLLNDTIPFRCRFPGSKGEVSFMGEIKNTKKKTDELSVGIKFVYPDNTDEIQNIINDYIQLIEYSSENV